MCCKYHEYNISNFLDDLYEGPDADPKPDLDPKP
jgi:hypothetical protein